MMLQKLLLRRDILVPYFSFRVELPGVATPETLKEVFRLRYDIYCLERGFLPAEVFSEELESDQFDAWSAHFAAYNHDDVIIASARLVQPPPSQPFPFEEHCTLFDGHRLYPREQSGEISRLVVRKSYRRRRGDSLNGISRDFMEKGSPATISPHPGGRKRSGDSPILLLGLYRELYRYSRRSGIRYWYAAMERSLARSLEKMGFRFIPVGPQTDYYGPVAPFVVDLDEAIANLRKQNKFLAAWFSDEPIPAWIALRTLIYSFMQRKMTRDAGPQRFDGINR